MGLLDSTKTTDTTASGDTKQQTNQNTNVDQTAHSDATSALNTNQDTNAKTTNDQTQTGTGTSTVAGNTAGASQQDTNTANLGINSSLLNQLNQMQQNVAASSNNQSSNYQSGSQSNAGTTSSTGTSTTALDPKLAAMYGTFSNAVQGYYVDPTTGKLSVPTDPSLQHYFDASNTALSNNSIADAAAPQWTDPGVSASYMNPYTSSVMAQQQQLAEQARAQQENQNNATYASSGAFGGSGQALSNASNRSLFNQAQMAAQAAALEQGYNNAYNEYATDKGLNVAAAQGQGQYNLAANTALGTAGQVAQNLPQQAIANYGAALNKIPTTGTTSQQSTGTNTSSGSSSSSGGGSSAGSSSQSTSGLSNTVLQNLAQSLNLGQGSTLGQTAGTSNQKADTSNQTNLSGVGTSTSNVKGTSNLDQSQDSNANTNTTAKGDSDTQSTATGHSTETLTPPLLSNLLAAAGLIKPIVNTINPPKPLLPSTTLPGSSPGTSTQLPPAVNYPPSTQTQTPPQGTSPAPGTTPANNSTITYNTPGGANPNSGQTYPEGGYDPSGMNLPGGSNLPQPAPVQTPLPNTPGDPSWQPTYTVSPSDNYTGSGYGYDYSYPDNYSSPQYGYGGESPDYNSYAAGGPLQEVKRPDASVLEAVAHWLLSQRGPLSKAA